MYVTRWLYLDLWTSGIGKYKMPPTGLPQSRAVLPSR
uniref:Uncharacterized protein n=1 Tax=Rhizophora mucronata TaxID=61149 RepID=A0A2P2LP99_RHIMU